MKTHNSFSEMFSANNDTTYSVFNTVYAASRTGIDEETGEKYYFVCSYNENTDKVKFYTVYPDSSNGTPRIEEFEDSSYYLWHHRNDTDIKKYINVQNPQSQDLCVYLNKIVDLPSQGRFLDFDFKPPMGEKAKFIEQNFAD